MILRKLDQSFFIKDNDKLLRDTFEDEIALVFKTEKGLIIFSGCAHKGIIEHCFISSRIFQ